MLIEIEPTNETPIYLQVMFQIKKAILRGDISPGDNLPSVRMLASDLGINMHTINKAYNLLVDESVLGKSQKGYFIQENHSRFASEAMKNEMKNRLETVVVDAFIHQLPEEEVESWIEEIIGELKKGEIPDVDI